jgi:S1-C subfamily serine protease
MISGQATLVPESDDYGPCFRRVAVKIPRFDFGFGPDEIGRRAVVENLRPGSNAAKAGLKDGDKITYAFSTDGALRDPNMMVTMHVTRGDQTFDVSYLPRAELRDAYQWERTDVPESACK